MNSKLLETLEKDSVISSHFASLLKQDFEVLRKTADASAMASKAGDFLKGVLPHIAVILGTSAIAGGFGYVAAKKKFDEHQGNLTKSRSTVFGQDPLFQEHPSDFHQRFSELSLISPTVASNPNMAQKLIAARLHDGFDLDDIHRLSAIEYHTTHAGRAVAPASAARSKALSQLENTVGQYAPSVIHDIMGTAGMHSKTLPPGTHRERSDSDLAQGALHAAMSKTKASAPTKEDVKGAGDRVKDMLKKKGSAIMEKKASIEGIDLAVSEECLGRMLGDRHCMFKQAGAAGALKDAFKASAGHMGDYLKFMAIPLAIGGGIQLVHKMMQQKETAQLKAEAERVYGGLVRSNEKIKANKEIAAEAFDALRSFAPALATKPIVMRTFIENTIDGSINDKEGRLGPEGAKLLTETQDLVNRLNNASGGSFMAGLKENMGIFTHSVKKPGQKD